MALDASILEEFVSAQQLALEDTFLVAVSGGRDSVSLLTLLVNAGFLNLTVCHLNHCLRGEESDADEAFVQSLSENLELGFISKRVEVGKLPGGLESAAREARYTFFYEVAEELDAKGVFLGHHLNDQIETVLYNLLRGGAGLKGIQPVVNRNGLLLYRPLLKVRREAITAFSKERKLEYREDTSNGEGVTARNRIRNELLPLAKDILARDVVSAVERARESAELDDSFVSSSVKLEMYIDPQGRLYLPRLKVEHEAIRRKVIYAYLKEKGIGQINNELIKKANEMVSNVSVNKINLAGGNYLRRRQRRIFVQFSE